MAAVKSCNARLVMALTALMRQAMGRRGVWLNWASTVKPGSSSPYRPGGRLVVLKAEEKRSVRSSGIGGPKAGPGRDAAIMVEVERMRMARRGGKSEQHDGCGDVGSGPRGRSQIVSDVDVIIAFLTLPLALGLRNEPEYSPMPFAEPSIASSIQSYPSTSFSIWKKHTSQHGPSCS